MTNYSAKYLLVKERRRISFFFFLMDNSLVIIKVLLCSISVFFSFLDECVAVV